jgi:hypothetical protein
MVTKTFPMPLGSPRRKHILTIIEIKVDSKDVEAVSEDPTRSTLAGAQTQLERYIDRIMRTQGISCEVPFVAYLVYGRFYQRVTVNTVQPFGGIGINLSGSLYDLVLDILLSLTSYPKSLPPIGT